MHTPLGVRPDATMEKLRFLRLGTGLNIELFQYKSPEQRTVPPLNSDVGGHHIALYVENFDIALAYLRSHGVEVLGEPPHRVVGQSAVPTGVYFRGPWGLHLEQVGVGPGGE